MKTGPVAGGYIIEFTPPSNYNKDGAGEIEGTIIAYEGWDKKLDIPSQVEIDKAYDNQGKDKKDKEYNIKATIKVTGIELAAFENYIYAEEIIIPDTVTTIGKFAFKKCIGLKYAYIPGSVKEIPDYCFVGCSSLEKVEFQVGLKKIGDFAFSSCEKLSSISIPGGCYHIGFSCFEKCRVLRNVEFPKDFNINKVDYLAFKFSGFEKKFADMLDNKKQ